MCAYTLQHKRRTCTLRHTCANCKSAVGSHAPFSRNSAINTPLTIHFNPRSLRSRSPFSIQGPFMGLIFRFPSGGIDQKAHLGFSRWTLQLMANCAVSPSVQTIAIIYLIGHSSDTQSWTFRDPPGIYNLTGPNAPHSSGVHNFRWD